MEVSCSSCPARYAIPDQKVQGRKVRLQCKRCGAAIIVDGTAAASASPPAASPQATATATPAAKSAASPPAPAAPRPAAASPAPTAPKPAAASPAPTAPKPAAAPPKPAAASHEPAAPTATDAAPAKTPEPAKPEPAPAPTTGWREPGRAAGPTVAGAGTPVTRKQMQRTIIGGLTGPEGSFEPIATSAATATPAPPRAASPEPPRAASPGPPRAASPEPPRPAPDAAARAPRAVSAKQTMMGFPGLDSGAAPAPAPAKRGEALEPAKQLAPIAPASTPPPALPRPGGRAEWTVAITDDHQEELTTAEVIELYIRGAIDAETYLWADGMGDWSQPWDVPALAAALRLRGQVPPVPGGEPRDTSNFMLAHSDDFGEDEHTVVADLMDSVRRAPAAGHWHEPGSWDAAPPALDDDREFDEVTVATDAPTEEFLRQLREQQSPEDAVDDLLDDPRANMAELMAPAPAQPSADLGFYDDSDDTTEMHLGPDANASLAALLQQARDQAAPARPAAPAPPAPASGFGAPPAAFAAPPAAAFVAPPAGPAQHAAFLSPGPPPAAPISGVPPTLRPVTAPRKGSSGCLLAFVIFVVMLGGALTASYFTGYPPELWRLPFWQEIGLPLR